MLDENSVVFDVTLDTTCEDDVCDVTMDSSVSSQGQLGDMALYICSTPTKITASVCVVEGKTFILSTSYYVNIIVNPAWQLKLRFCEF